MGTSDPKGDMPEFYPKKMCCNCCSRILQKSRKFLKAKRTYIIHLNCKIQKRTFRQGEPSKYGF